MTQHGDAGAPASAAEVVGVLGGGTMGSGIAHVLLAAGMRTVLVEVDEQALERAAGLVRRSLTGAADRGKLSADPDDLMSRLEATTQRAALSDCSLVIEAVPEILSLKRQLLAEVEGHLAETAVLATNTSSLSLADLASGLTDRKRFLGLHFFNPVPASALVEIVRLESTAPGAVHRAQQLVEALGKEMITVADSPGFATSRLGVVLGLEAIRMLESGVASAEDIDRGMQLGYRHPMGPLRLTDLVGLDVRLGIAEYLWEKLGPRFEPPPLLRSMVAEGKLGKKSGEGFYRWA